VATLELSLLFSQDHFPPAIIAAMRTSLVWQLGLVAVRALGNGRIGQPVV